MKSNVKRIAIAAAAAAMALTTIGTASMAASAAEKHPGESGYGYVNEYGKHPGESGCQYTPTVEEQLAAYGIDLKADTREESKQELLELLKNLNADQVRQVVNFYNYNGFICGNFMDQLGTPDDEVNEYGKHPGEAGYNYNGAAIASESKYFGFKVYGDVTCDGIVDVADSVLLSRFVAEEKGAVLSAQGKINADMDNDGQITAKDNAKILSIIAKNE